MLVSHPPTAFVGVSAAQTVPCACHIQAAAGRAGSPGGISSPRSWEQSQPSPGCHRLSGSCGDQQGLSVCVILVSIIANN